MRRKLVLTLGLSALLVLGVAAVAIAKFDVFRAGNLILKADGGVSPKALPKSKFAPVTVHVAGKISTSDGTHPSAFREATIDFDKNGTINTTGLPICKSGQLQATDTKAAKKACGKTEVGSGNGEVEIAFPEQGISTSRRRSPSSTAAPGAARRRCSSTPTSTCRSPLTIVTTVTITKIHAGRYGLRTVSKVPVIAGGSGSILSFDINFGKTYTYKGKKMSYIMAKCPDGHFNADVKSAIFKNEAKVPGVASQTTLKGTVIRPCTPKG